jgi:hypothetical protein
MLEFAHNVALHYFPLPNAGEDTGEGEFTFVSDARHFYEASGGVEEFVSFLFFSS